VIREGRKYRPAQPLRQSPSKRLHMSPVEEAKTVLSELKSRKRPKPAGRLAASSDTAHAVGRQRNPHHRDHGYQDLPLVSPPPVVQPLH
jgi:hypothetical protein